MEIKFRAWDKISKTIYLVVRLWFENGVLQNVWIETSEGLVAKRSLDDVILLQYTGFKDSNGKEIYEGDILQHGNDGKPVCVEWDNEIGSWILKRIDKGWTQPMYYYTEKNTTILFHIIGNVFENPELLEEDGWELKKLTNE